MSKTKIAETFRQLYVGHHVLHQLLSEW